MENVILIIHLLLALSIIALVLLQRSEGGGLGIGGGGGGVGGMATPQTTANIMTRATAILAGCFFLTSLTLAILAGGHSQNGSILDVVEEVPAPAPAIEGAAPNEDITNGAATGEDSSGTEEVPSVPVSE